MAIARQIAEAYFAAALDRGNLEDALRQLRHDVEFDSPAAQIRGRDELRPYLEEFARAFPDARYKLSWGVESGSRVALEGVYSATHTGTLRMPDGSELAATGSRERPFVALCDVQGDKISSHRAYWDVATVMAQLRLSPPRNDRDATDRALRGFGLRHRDRAPPRSHTRASA
jgi:predicted ester cyclase